jgi:hypothetical protein
MDSPSCGVGYAYPAQIPRSARGNGCALCALRLGCRLLAPWLGLRPALYLRSLAQRHPLRLPDDCSTLWGYTVLWAFGRCRRSVSSTIVVGFGQSWAAARGVSSVAASFSRYALAPQLWGRSGLLPCRRPSLARGGPPSPASLPPLATLAPAKGLAGFGSAVSAFGGRFYRLTPTFQYVGCRYCSESASPAPSGVGSGALSPAVPCFLRGAQSVGRSASAPPVWGRPTPPPLGLSRVLCVLGAVAPRALPTFWLVGSRVARPRRAWVSRLNRLR